MGIKKYEKDCKAYPCHPVETSKYLNYPVGHHGCLGCGSFDHEFRGCPTISSQNG